MRAQATLSLALSGTLSEAHAAAAGLGRYLVHCFSASTKEGERDAKSGLCPVMAASTLNAPRPIASREPCLYLALSREREKERDGEWRAGREA